MLPPLHAADVGISVDSAADVAKAAAVHRAPGAGSGRGARRRDGSDGARSSTTTGKYILMASSANFGNIAAGMVLAGLILPFPPAMPAYPGAADEPDFTISRRPDCHWTIARPRGYRAPHPLGDLRHRALRMIVMGPISTVFDVFTFAVLLRLFPRRRGFLPYRLVH